MTDPDWLKKMAKDSYEYLSNLPPSSQPTWFRVHHGDWGYMLKKDAEKIEDSND